VAIPPRYVASSFLVHIYPNRVRRGPQVSILLFTICSLDHHNLHSCLSITTPCSSTMIVLMTQPPN